MSGPPKRNPRRGAPRASGDWQGETPKTPYSAGGLDLNREINVFALGHSPAFEEQVEILNGIKPGQIKAALVRDADPARGDTVLGGTICEVVIVVHGAQPSSSPLFWTFYRFPTFDHAMFAAGVVASKGGLPVIDDTTAGRAKVPAVLS